MEEVKYLDVTERILRESVKEVNGELERRQVVDGVFRFVNYLEAVQRMPVVARLSLYSGGCAAHAAGGEAEPLPSVLRRVQPVAPQPSAGSTRGHVRRGSEESD